MVNDVAQRTTTEDSTPTLAAPTPVRSLNDLLKKAGMAPKESSSSPEAEPQKKWNAVLLVQTPPPQDRTPSRPGTPIDPKSFLSNSLAVEIFGLE